MLAYLRMAIIVAPLSRDLTKFPVGTTASLDEFCYKRYQLSLNLNCLYKESGFSVRVQI